MLVALLLSLRPVRKFLRRLNLLPRRASKPITVPVK